MCAVRRGWFFCVRNIERERERERERMMYGERMVYCERHTGRLGKIVYFLICVHSAIQIFDLLSIYLYSYTEREAVRVIEKFASKNIK